MVWVWIIAYLIAGEGFVAKDASEPLHNQPAYIRTTKGRWGVRLFWPFVSIWLWILLRKNSQRIRSKYFGGQFLPTWFLFIAIGSIGTLVAGWIMG